MVTTSFLGELYGVADYYNFEASRRDYRFFEASYLSSVITELGTIDVQNSDIELFDYGKIIYNDVTYVIDWDGSITPTITEL